MSDWGTPDRAWNSPPESGPRLGRLSRQGREKPVNTRCTHYIDGTILCDTFPSWPVPGSRNERRCAAHKEEKTS